MDYAKIVCISRAAQSTKNSFPVPLFTVAMETMITIQILLLETFIHAQLWV